MKRLFLLIVLLSSASFSFAATDPVSEMLERIDQGSSRKFAIELRESDKDFFELDRKGNKVVVRGNTYVNIAAGVNWYLKYYAGIHLSWNGMKADIPDDLPPVLSKERHETDLSLRYDFNYCTFSYSMPFWDWERWEQEIDWMALHGINLPLAAVGTECVWKNVMTRLGYSRDEIADFIAGPAFLAWFEMNNIEGWAGPLPDSWYARQEDLQKKILARMREWGIKPVLPGYSGMVPHDADKRLGLNIADPGLWNGIQRPAFLVPTDSRFQEIASIYYEEQQKLFGKADYYSMDPFHESATSGGIDFADAGKAVMNAMKAVNKDAVWVLQAWSENPRDEMIEPLKKGDLLILDLFSECRPMWGMESLWKKDNGYGSHDWLFCMLENFGGKVGLHGRMDQLIENFYLTKTHPMASELSGIGLTMEAGENNPVMFELMCELPWRERPFTKEEWIRDWCFARYGARNPAIEEAWELLAGSIYNCPRRNNQQGPHESVFCARPSKDVFWVYERSKVENYYDPADVRIAASLMLSVADDFRGNNNFEYDLVDIVRQAVADKGRSLYQHCMADFRTFDRRSYEAGRDAFLNALLLQDRLLSSRKEFMVGNWLSKALECATNDDEAALFEWNARVQITTWGDRNCADGGKLHDYAHKEWNGILKDFYYNRWKTFFDALEMEMDGAGEQVIDFFAVEEPWTGERKPYPAQALCDPVSTAAEVFEILFSE